MARIEFTYPRKFTEPIDALNARALEDYLRRVQWAGVDGDDIKEGTIPSSAFGGSVPGGITVVAALPSTGSVGDVVFLTSDNKMYRWDGLAWILDVDGADLTALTVEYAAFAASLEPVQLVDDLADIVTPTAGMTVLLSTDSKLYRYTGSAWTASVPTTDLTGEIVEGQIATDAVTAVKIAADAVTNAKIAAGAVDTLELAADAVEAAQLAVDAVTADAIAANAVNTSEIADGAVDTLQIAALAVDSAQIAVDAITNSKIATGAVDTTEIAAAAIEAAQLGIDAVTSSAIAAGAVDTAELAASAVETTKIAVDAVTEALIATDAVTSDAIAASAVTATEILAGTITATEIAALTITASEIAANTIGAGQIAASAITTDELDALAVTAAKIAVGTITASQIAAGAITTTELDALAVTAAKIAANTITAGQIAAGTITATEIQALTITAAEIAAGTITASQIAAGTITASEIAAQSIAVKHLLVTNFDNHIRNANFEMGAAGEGDDPGHYTSGGGTGWSSTTDAAVGDTAAKYTCGAQVSSAVISPNAYYNAANEDKHMQVMPGETIVATVQMKYGGTAPAVYPRLYTYFVDKDWASLGWTSTALNATTSYGSFTHTYVAPAGAVHACYLVLFGTGNASDTVFYVDAMTQRRANDAHMIVDGAVTADKILAGAVSTDKLDALAVTAAEIAAGAITTVKLDAGAVTAAKITAGTITTTEIATDTIVAGNIAAGAVTASEIFAGAVTAVKIDAGAVTTDKLDALAVTAAKIAAGTITATQIDTDTIVAGNIAAGAINASELATDSVIAVKIKAGEIATAHMVADSIDGDRITTNTLNADRIITNTITAGKLEAAFVLTNQVISADYDATPGLETGWQIDYLGNAYFNNVTIRGDLYGGWDGGSDLSSYDATATAGFFLDATAGSAQFAGDFFLTGTFQAISGSGDVGLEMDDGIITFPMYATPGVGTHPYISVVQLGPSPDEYGQLLIAGMDHTASTGQYPRIGLTTQESDFNGIHLGFGLDGEFLFTENDGGGFQGLNGDGTQALPPYAFVSDPDTGIYRYASNVLGFTTGGAARLLIGSTEIIPLYPVRGIAGTANAPTFSFNLDNNTGIYNYGANQIAFSTAGTRRFSIDGNGHLFGAASTGAPLIDYAIGTASDPAYTFYGDGDTGMYRYASNIIGFSTGGVRRFYISTDAFGNNAATGCPRMKLDAAGSSTAPTYSFEADTNTGMYRAGTDQLAFTTGGTARFNIRGGTIQTASTVAGGTILRMWSDGTNFGGTGSYRRYDWRRSVSYGDLELYGVKSDDTATLSVKWSDAGDFYMVRAGGNTTGSAASCYLATNGLTQRSTSARKYKTEIDYDTDYLADYVLSPAHFYRKDDERYWLGFIADDLGEQDEMLGEYDDGEIENYDSRALMAVMAAKINRLEKLVGAMQGEQ